jgi:hypothetical protein
VEPYPFDAGSIGFFWIHPSQRFDLAHANERFHCLRVI